MKIERAMQLLAKFDRSNYRTPNSFEKALNLLLDVMLEGINDDSIKAKNIINTYANKILGNSTEALRNGEPEYCLSLAKSLLVLEDMGEEILSVAPDELKNLKEALAGKWREEKGEPRSIAGLISDTKMHMKLLGVPNNKIKTIFNDLPPH